MVQTKRTSMWCISSTASHSNKEQEQDNTEEESE